MKGRRSGSAKSLEAGTTARYAASPVGVAESGRPTTTWKEVNEAMNGWVNVHLSDHALDAVGTDNQVSPDDLTAREGDTGPAFARVNLCDGGAESDIDVAGFCDKVEKETVKIGTVDVVIWRVVVIFHAKPLGVANLFARLV